MDAWRAILLATGGDALGAVADVGAGIGPCLLPVANRPLAEHALRGFARAGLERVTVVAEGRVAPAMQAAIGSGSAIGVRVEHLAVPDDCGDVQALLAARDLVGDHPLVVQTCGSLMLDDLGELIARFEREQLDALVVGSPSRVRVVPIDSGGVAVHDRISDPVGVYLLGPDALEELSAVEGREAEAADLAGAAGRLAGGGRRVRTVLAREGWRFRPGGDALLEVHRLVLDRLEPSIPPEAVEDSDIHGRVAIHRSATVRSSTIRGPVIIGAGARVVDSWIGPYTAIGRNATVDAAEVEHSVLLAGATIRNVGVRLSSSVIGPQARVTRSFALPRALRLEVGLGAAVELS